MRFAEDKEGLRTLVLGEDPKVDACEHLADVGPHPLDPGLGGGQPGVGGALVSNGSVGDAEAVDDPDSEDAPGIVDRCDRSGGGCAVRHRRPVGAGDRGEAGLDGDETGITLGPVVDRVGVDLRDPAAIVERVRAAELGALGDELVGWVEVGGVDRRGRDHGRGERVGGGSWRCVGCRHGARPHEPCL